MKTLLSVSLLSIVYVCLGQPKKLEYRPSAVLSYYPAQDELRNQIISIRKNGDVIYLKINTQHLFDDPVEVYSETPGASISVGNPIENESGIYWPVMFKISDPQKPLKIKFEVFCKVQGDILMPVPIEERDIYDSQGKVIEENVTWEKMPKIYKHGTRSLWYRPNP